MVSLLIYIHTIHTDNILNENMTKIDHICEINAKYLTDKKTSLLRKIESVLTICVILFKYRINNFLFHYQFDFCLVELLVLALN